MINGYGDKTEFYDLIDLVNSYITANKLHKPRLYRDHTVEYLGCMGQTGVLINTELETPERRVAYECRFVYHIGRREFVLKISDGIGFMTRVGLLTEVTTRSDSTDELMYDMEYIFMSKWQTSHAVNYHEICHGDARCEYIRSIFIQAFNRMNKWADSY